MKAQVYTLSDPNTNKIRYIGVTIRTLEVRLLEHIKECFSNKVTHKLNWIRSLLEQNLKPHIELLANIEESDIDKIYEKEQEIIRIYKEAGFNLTNGTDGGKGTWGHILSKEAKDKIANKASQQWVNYTKEKKTELSLQTSKRLKGNSYRKGKKDPPHRIESKKGIIKGKGSPTWKGYIVKLDKNMQELQRWESISDAAKELDVDYRSIWLAAKTGKTCKKYFWKYDLHNRI